MCGTGGRVGEMGLLIQRLRCDWSCKLLICRGCETRPRVFALERVLSPTQQPVSLTNTYLAAHSLILANGIPGDGRSTSTAALLKRLY